MSQISVVQYNPPLNKINVLQQNNVINQQNDRQIIVLRKPQQILPQDKELNKDDILLTNNGKKKQKSGKEIKTSPPTVSVARRNARERNRVKQVNNGFATLRQHIPNFIAATFENSNGRGGNKKLSKVETLRMAVEYIRNLENILTMDIDHSEINEHISELSYPSPSSSTSPSHHNQSNLTYTYQVLSPPEDDDVCTSATPSPQQFIKINDSNSYHIIPTLYENGENLDPMSVDEHILSDPSLMDPNLEFSVNSQDLSYLNSMNTNSSLSPGFYSEDSLSPNSIDRSEQKCFIPVFNTPPEDRLSASVNICIKAEVNELPVISLKTENELPEEHKGNIVDVLHWWDQQPQNSGS